MQSRLGGWLNSPKVRSEPFRDQSTTVTPHEKTIPCPWSECGRMFQSQGHLKQHVLSAGGPHLKAWNSGITSVERFWQSANLQMSSMLEPLVSSLATVSEERPYDDEDGDVLDLDQVGDGDEDSAAVRRGEEIDDVPRSQRNDERVRLAQPTAKRRKALQKRFRFTTREKFKVIQQFDRLLDEMKRIVDGKKVATFGLRKKILDQMSLRTGIKSSTLSDWMLVANRARIEDEVIRLDKNRRAKTMKVMWSPKLARPWFPETEQRLKAEILADRAQHRRFSRFKAMKRYKELAEEENSEKFALAKIQNALIDRFLKRSRLSVRLPGCVKSKPLEVAIKEVRGFLVWCREELHHDTGNYRKNEELDPTYGRFPLAWRVNKDEVPMRFGQTNKTIDVKGTKNVHVSYPDGWGERIATLVLAASADGHILDVILIFKGSDEASKKPMIEERKGYEEDARFAGVHVVFQKKAWIDRTREEFVLKKQVLPYAKKLQRDYPDRKVDLLLQQDNVAAHFHPNCLRLCAENGIFALGSPPNLTNYIQLIDANVGKAFRGDVYGLLDEEIDRMENELEPVDEGPAAKVKLTLGQKRQMVAELVARTLAMWRRDDRKKDLVRKAAARTGFSLPAYGPFPGLKPQNFPSDFHDTVCDSSHPLHDVISEFKFETKRRENVPDGGPNRIDAVAPGLEEEEEMFDGWSSEEEECIYLDHELPTESRLDDEYLMEAEDEALVIRRRGNRGCLEDCGCNNERPRKCGCNRLGGCSLSCCCKGNCSVGLRGGVAEENDGDFVDIDTALRVADGEAPLKAILSRGPDGLFEAQWEGGDVTWQPLEDFVDDDEGGFYHPAILPFLTEYEKTLLEAGDLAFVPEALGEEVAEVHRIDTSSPNPPQAPQAAQTINYIINIQGGNNTVSQGPSGGPNKRRKK